MDQKLPDSQPALLDHDPDACFLAEADARLCASNPAARKLGERLLLDGLEELLPVNHAALIRACLTQQRAIGDVERRIGDLILLWTFIPDLQRQRVLIRGRDATSTIARLDEATRSNRLYRLITENSTDLISRHAPDGRFLDASPASWRLLGYWPEQLRGKRLDDIIAPGTLDEQMEEARTQLRDTGYATLTLQVLHREGSKRWFEIASRAIRETYTGTVIEVISVSRDITARVQSEEENRRLADELAHAARLATLGELASGIAHEMNQPLATIVNYASASQRYLNQARDNPDMLARVQDGLGRITQHANHASEVIKRLRAFLRKGQKRSATINVNNTVKTAIRLCQWEADKHRVTIIQTLSEREPTLTADPVLLEQVLINLIRNAIDANREHHCDQQPSQVTIATRQEGSGHDNAQIFIEVVDQGPGLDEEGLKQMFTPFYTRKSHGLGLGLSMSRSIVEGFGGFLDASPDSSGGLRLTCRFPLTPAPRQPHQTHQPQQQRASQ
ncbi:MAG: PAS domain S-box protein [Marinobacter sp.]|uniref:PAS domain-containing sensor histidine kinase n=1 Tax=Marinobacter sp. TaxID=50741 RepID=UPI00299D56C9|nr:ATP-binding protein [Marinobacter sp.]MDX1754590.1 PAS domain S-box protein [Marinobacter sp.]